MAMWCTKKIMKGRWRGGGGGGLPGKQDYFKLETIMEGEENLN
jgi:hypothetical protein